MLATADPLLGHVGKIRARTGIGHGHRQTRPDNRCAGRGQAKHVETGQQPLSLGVVCEYDPPHVVDFRRECAAPLSQRGRGGLG